MAQLRTDGGVREVPVDEVCVGDVVMVRPGEVVAVDGIVASGEAILDESTLTGEPLPVSHHRGDRVRSGTSNAGAPFDVRATRRASESADAAMVRLVRDAEREKAPFLRFADRYAGIFLPVTLVVAGLPWALSGDAVRALAVLVVATPCPPHPRGTGGACRRRIAYRQARGCGKGGDHHRGAGRGTHDPGG